MVNSINSAPDVKVPASNIGMRYLENLSKIIEYGYDNGKGLVKYSARQINEALSKINARELAAFGNLAAGGNPQAIRRYAEAFVRYYNKLSPEEQNSARYKGTREKATALIEEANALIDEAKSGSGSKTDKNISQLEMMRNEMLDSFRKNGINVGAAAQAAYNIGRVNISKEARKLAGQS